MKQEMNGHLEIERRYLLSALPEFPPNVISVEMRQGYYKDDDGKLVRLRQAKWPAGSKANRESAIYTRTIKEGSGLVRQEWQKTIDKAAFDQDWPLTKNWWLRKTRHRVMLNTNTEWVIDSYPDYDVILAEIEFEDPAMEIVVPDWIAKVCVREVTEEPRYSNASIAWDGVP